MRSFRVPLFLAQSSGRGPLIRLTFKVCRWLELDVLATLVAVKGAQREIAEFRRFQHWSHTFVAVYEKIYQQRRVEDEPATAPGKTAETIRDLPIAVGQSVPVLYVQMETESMVSKKNGGMQGRGRTAFASSLSSCRDNQPRGENSAS
jgi:hypothetical protein